MVKLIQCAELIVAVLFYQLPCDGFPLSTLLCNKRVVVLGFGHHRAIQKELCMWKRLNIAHEMDGPSCGDDTLNTLGVNANIDQSSRQGEGLCGVAHIDQCGGVRACKEVDIARMCSGEVWVEYGGGESNLPEIVINRVDSVHGEDLNGANMKTRMVCSRGEQTILVQGVMRMKVCHCGATHVRQVMITCS